jgi:hypothetical protein
MARAKIDGVIEAVRYTPGGKIALVRMYERHGVVWSDRILLERKELIDRLSKRKRFVTGERKYYQGSVFETGASIKVSNEQIITEGQKAEGDLLAGVPVF